MEKLSRKEKTRLVRVMASEMFMENDHITYNAVAKEIGTSNHITRSVYLGLVSAKLIKERGYTHYKIERKVKVKTDEKVKKRILAAFIKYPDFTVSQVAKKAKSSHGACYKLHDIFVREGKIETRRTLRTKVAQEPPLYVLKVSMYNLLKSNKNMTIAEACILLDFTVAQSITFHDELVNEGKIKARKLKKEGNRNVCSLKKKEMTLKAFNDEANSGYGIQKIAIILNMADKTVYKYHDELVKERKIKSRRFKGKKGKAKK